MLKTMNMKKSFVFLIVLVLVLSAIGLSMRVNAAEENGSKGEIDVYLIAGQSNAVGYGEVSNLTATDERFTNGFDNVLYYGEGEHWDGVDNKPPLQFVPTTVGLGQKPTSSGAEIGIASALGDNGKMNAIIKCAWGGTSIYNSTAETSLKYGTWTSPTYIKNHNISTEGNKCGRLYTWFLETVTHGLDMLEADGYTPVIKGIWWMQGEAETGGANTANAYNELLTTLINDMRRDLGEITGVDQSKMPFVLGEITSNHAAFGNATPAYIDVVCQAQLDVAAALDNVFVLDTTGLAQQDNWHYTADAQIIIGEKFVEIALAASGDVPTAYGIVPKESVYDENGVKIPLAMFQGGKYLASYSDWNAAMTEAKAKLSGKAKDAVQVEVVLMDNFTASKYDNASQMGGTLVIDLNGYTLSTGKADHLLNGFGKIYATGKICDTNIIFKNGSFIIGTNKILTSFGIYTASYPAAKTFSYRFDNVKFGFAEGATATTLIAGSANHSIDTDATLKMTVDMEFNNCVFDLFTNAPSGSQLFKFNESTSKGAIVQNVRINGGTIIKSSYAKGSLYTLGTAEGRVDSVTFGKYDNHYTKLALPTGVAPAADSFAASDESVLGALVWAKTGTDEIKENEKDIYELTCLTTKYGTIPSSLASIADYPFVVFKFNNGTLEGVSGYAKLMGVSTNDGAFHYAKQYLETNEWNAESGYAGQKTAVIFQRCDYTTLAGEVYENMAQVRGVVTYDLNGYKLSQNKTKAISIFKFGTKPWAVSGHAPIFPTTFNIINGDIEIYSAALMTLQMTPCSAEGYSINNKIYTINYENVTFGLADGATATNMFFSYWAGSKNTNDPDPMAPYFVNFNGCTFDLTSNVPAKNFRLFNIAPISTNYICNTVSVNGGVIKTKYWDNYIAVANSGTFGSTLSFGKYNGSYTALELPSIEEYPSYLNTLDSVVGIPLTFTLTKTEGIVKSYILGESVFDKYCYIPHRYSDASVYPYIVIVYDGKGNITAIEGTTKLLGTSETAFNVAKNAVSTNKWNATTGYDGQLTAVILARRDYVVGASEVYDNMAQIRGEVTLDLNGYTLSQTNTAKAKPLFFITSKAWEGVFPTTVNIINGKLLTYNGAVFSLNMWMGTSSLTDKLFTFNLVGVTIGLCEGATANNLLVSYGTSKIESVWVGKEAIAPYFLNLTDCVIDLETVKPVSNINLFNISPNAFATNYMSGTVNVNGCEIKADSLDNINFVTEAQNGSSLSFGKMAGGNYTSLTLSRDASAPSFAVNGGALEFVKVSETADTVTYRLRPTEVSNISYAPKMSITLANGFVVNVYVPTNYTQMFTFNGVTYNSDNNYGGNAVEVNGNKYYLVTAPLGSSEGAKELQLAASVKVGETEATATFTFSIPKYVAKVLADKDAATATKTLAKDVLAYVKEAYNYAGFAGHNTAEEIARVNALINSIIGADYKAVPWASGVTVNSGAVTAVTLNLDATPTIRFYTENTSLEFYADGKKLNTVSGVDANGTYVELDVYAYALRETITYGNGGSYHISSFVNGAGENEKALAEAFAAYVESAAAYRDQVIKEVN